MAERPLPSLADSVVTGNRLRLQRSTRRQPSHCDKPMAKPKYQRDADRRHRHPSHEVKVELRPNTQHEVMAILAQLLGTIARLQRRRLRRDTARETPAAPLLLQPPPADRVLDRWQRRQRRLEADAATWFSVFPGSVRPVSTTWPWTIKPALAVLWGVCWQFYEPPPPSPLSGSFDAADGDGRARVRAASVLKGLEWWQAPDARAGAYLQFGRDAVATALGGARGQQLQAGDGAAGGAEAPALEFRNPNLRAPAAAQPQLRRNPRNRRAQGSNADPRPPTAAGHLYANALSPNASPCEAQACEWPYESASGIATFVPTSHHLSLHARTTTTSLHDPFDWFSHHQDPSQLTPSLPVPELRIEDSSLPTALQPAPVHAPASPANDYISSRTLSPRRAALSSPSLYVSPMDAAVAHVPQVMPDFCKASGPVSPVSMNEEAAAQMSPAAISTVANPRKRKLSDVSLAAHPVQPAANPQLPIRESSEEQDRYDGYTPRGKYSHKRTEDPPRNAEGKMVCNFSSDCHGVTFDRKCEWSKHMDKHDRPYVCRHKGCEKLQGFTYSGGLLRHEREVHKMHGGTKKALFCPHQDCKRSMGQGFTRKENLAEHIRRVHRRASGSDAAPSPTAQPGGQSKPEDEGASEAGLSPDAEADEVYGGAVGERRVGPSPSKKRRMSGTDGGGSVGGGGGETDEDDLREEIRRLRRENEEKDDRLKKLEAAVEALSRGQAAPMV
ncbi:c2h2 transcription factor [Diplodia corticola]|uniref:C2h2 transcription factor n=1 Tax=Diplodia corticola TaxID=236234 RepID=A0A1J9RAD4_9PEZI|nr:c2h2 transcription factor [Diplodia corticola]OJD29379.1 c2h2 transcription factor [Diplodia corticola]